MAAVRLVSTILLFSLWGAWAGAASGAETGVVLGLTGEWKWNGARLRFAQRDVPLTATLSCEPGSSLLVAFDAHPPFHVQSACEKPRVVLSEEKRVADSPGLISRLKAAVVPLFERSPETAFVAVSRDFGRELREAVVEVRGGEADLAPAFGTVVPGNYRLRARLAEGSAPGSVFAVQWKPGTPARAALRQPGLYEVTVLEDSGAETGGGAWILACPPETFASASAAFGEAVKATSDWEQSLEPGALRPALRAYLRALAAEALR